MVGMENAWLIPIYCVCAFVVISLLGRYLPNQGAFLSVIAILAGFVTFWVVLGDLLERGLPDVTGQYHYLHQWFRVGDLEVAWGTIVDPLSVVMIGLITFVALGVQVYSLSYMRGDSRFGWYFAVQSLFAASMLTLVLADNLLLLYVVWELVGFCSYLLIGFWFERRSATEAAKKAFITTRVGDVGLLVGILILFANTGTFDLSETFTAVAGGEISELALMGSGLLIFLGAMGKSAQFPLHVWLPDAMEGPTPVSALIHAATMVAAGVFLIARLFPLYQAIPDAGLAIAVIGITTALIGASLALVTTDLKRILAYSTVSHLGFMMLALGAGGYTAGMFHLVTHGLAKAMLFLCAGCIMHAMHDEMDIRKMGGLRHRMPITAVCFCIGALALAGIPPLSAFFSKDEILLAVRDGLNPSFLLLLIFAMALSGLYMARAVRLVFFGALKRENQKIHEASPIMSAPIIVLGVATLLVGFVALPLASGYNGFGSFLFYGHMHKFEFSLIWGPIGILVAAGSFLAGWLIYSESNSWVERIRTRFAWVHQVLVNGYYVDSLYQWVIDNIVLQVSRVVAVFDRLVVNDLGVNGIADSVRYSGERLRRHVSGRFYNYGMAMCFGVSAIFILLWAGVF